MESVEADNKRAWAEAVHELDCKTLAKHFEKRLKPFVASGMTTTTCKFPVNKVKCRYADAFCVDQTRVVLKHRPEEANFIHANWMFTPDKNATRYICTQAPLPETIEDFWHMCFTEGASLVVMICDRSELEKCSHYFPETMGEKMACGPYTVTNKMKLDEPAIEGVTCSVMEIKSNGETPHSQAGDTVVIKHCVMRDWVDNCAPTDTGPVLKLWRWVRKHHGGHPVVVHSSTGVGRAATFIGIELAIYRIQSDPGLNLADIVKELRVQRAHAIQSHVQFLYLYCAVADYFVWEGTAQPYSESRFITEYKRHSEKRTARMMKMAIDRANALLSMPVNDDTV